jgi:hypothetical protein
MKLINKREFLQATSVEVEDWNGCVTISACHKMIII